MKNRETDKEKTTGVDTEENTSMGKPVEVIFKRQIVRSIWDIQV